MRKEQSHQKMKSAMSTIEIPPSIQRILDRAIAEFQPSKIVIFGSRARQDNRPTSDFDLAFFGVQDSKAWAHFAADMIAEPPTLWGLDVMQYEKVPMEMQASIDRDGVTLYVRE